MSADAPTPRDNAGGDKPAQPADGTAKPAAAAGSLDLQGTAFDQLEQEFQAVIKTLADDKSLERFRLEYEKLHNTLRRSHENERKLVGKCKELASELQK